MGHSRAGSSDRKGFTAEERRAFLYGRKVLWKDSGKWWTGMVIAVRVDATQRQYVEVRNTGPATRNVGAGETTRAYPGSVKKA